MVNAKAVLAGEKPPAELGVRAVDERTLEVKLDTPLPYFPAMTTYATLFPAHRATIEAHGADWTAPGNMVSNGAYVLGEVVLNEYHTRTRNPMYWGAGDVIIEKVTGLVINDVNQALTRYRAGELDHLEPLPPGQYPALEEERPDEATSVPRLCSYYYAINHTESGNPALRDARVRRAPRPGHRPRRDRRPGAEGRAVAGLQLHPLQDGGLRDAGHRLGGAHSGARARRGGEEADGRSGGPASWSSSSSTTPRRATGRSRRWVSQMWKQKLGVETELANFEWKTYLGIRRNREFDIARSAWCGDYNEASTFLDLLTTTHGSNDGKYSNERVDELMRASKTAADPSGIYAEVERIIAEGHGHHPHLPLRQHVPPRRGHPRMALRQRGEQLVLEEPLPRRRLSAPAGPRSRTAGGSVAAVPARARAPAPGPERTPAPGAAREGSRVAARIRTPGASTERPPVLVPVRVGAAGGGAQRRLRSGARHPETGPALGGGNSDRARGLAPDACLPLQAARGRPADPARPRRRLLRADVRGPRRAVRHRARASARGHGEPRAQVRPRRPACPSRSGATSRRS